MSPIGAFPPGYWPQSSSTAAAAAAATRKRRPPPVEGRAYVAMIHGRKCSYCVEAAVLGQSLQNQGTELPMILLHTSDVPPQGLDLLEQIGWRLKLVEYIDGSKVYIHGHNGRFYGVFTKFHALNLCEYDTIAMLDVDLLVRKPADKILFDRKLPAALRRHASGNTFDGNRMSRRKSINAGVMVVRPDAEEFQKIREDLERGGHYKSRMPEQDYLSRRWEGAWHDLDVKFNFQIHQLAYCDRQGLEDCGRFMTRLSDVVIWHFSGQKRPVSFYCSTEWRFKRAKSDADLQRLRLQFLDGLAVTHMQGFDRDGVRNHSGFPRSDISNHVHEATVMSALEWFEVLDQLLKTHPRLLEGLLDACTEEEEEEEEEKEEEVTPSKSSRKGEKRRGGRWHACDQRKGGKGSPRHF